MNKLTISAGVAAAAVMLAGGAEAANPRLQATWIEYGQVVATWYQGFTPTPVADIPGYETQVPVEGFTLASSIETSVYYFGATPYGGGLEDSFGEISDTGPQIYTGANSGAPAESDPVFGAGTYQLANGVLTLTTAGKYLAASWTENGQLVATWDQASTPTPESYIAGYYTQAPITNWVLESAVETSVDYFAATPYGGGLQDALGYLNDTGPQIYTGGDIDLPAETDPVFTPGTYQLGSGTLILTSAPAPEPAAWALMLVGFGLIGSAVRRRRNALAA